MTKNLLKLILAASVGATAMPPFSFAQAKTVEEILQMKKEQNEQARQQILNLKGQLVDMQSALEKEEGHFGYNAAKYTRNISFALAGVAAVLTVVDYKTGLNRNFIAYGLVTAGFALLGLLGSGGVALSNDQVVTLKTKIAELQKQIVVVEAQLNQQK